MKALALLLLLASSAGAATLAPRKAARWLKKSPGKIVVLDLRAAKELPAGRIRGAVNMDFWAPDFEDRLLRLDKSKTYLVHCDSGGRSAKAAALMERLGFRKVYDLEGGIRAWSGEGLPVVK